LSEGRSFTSYKVETTKVSGGSQFKI